jgi:fumarate hydratase class I
MTKESSGSQASSALDVIATNIDMAMTCEGAIAARHRDARLKSPTPAGANQVVMQKQIEEAVAEATRLGKLRPNSVDSITGKNSETIWAGTPVLRWNQWENSNKIEVSCCSKAAAAKT